MKADRVLTIEECLNEWTAAPTHVNPPACDARHIPIAEENHVALQTNARGCNCDRWGHPCPDCVEKRNPQRDCD